MAYIARVELQGKPTYEDFENLHVAMANASFTRTIVGGNGTTYNLPHATYQSTAYSTAVGARDAVKKAAESVWSDVLVIVSGTDTAWYLSFT